MFAPVRRGKVGESCPYYSKVLDSLREWLPLEWCLGKAMQSSARNKNLFKSTKKLRLHERRALLRSLTFVFSRQQITMRLDSTFLVRIIWTAKIENEAFFAKAASCFAFHKGSGSSRVSFPAFDWLLEYRPRVCYNPSSCHGYGLMYLQICSRQSCLEDRKCRTIRFIGTNRD